MKDHQAKAEEGFFVCSSKADADQLIEDCADADVMVSTHDVQGNYTAVSGSCRSLFGYEPEQLIDTSAYDYFHPEDYQAVLRSHAKITLRPEVETVNYRLKKSHGEYVEVRSLSRQIKGDNGLDFILALTVERQ